ncbi:MAG: hypothetical protein ACT6U0_07930 [Shinella sp.]
MILKRETGSLSPRRQGHLGGGKLSAHREWVCKRLAQNGELMLDELCVELASCDLVVHRSSVGRLLYRLGLSHKKVCWQASSSDRKSHGRVNCGPDGASLSSTRHWRGWFISMRHRQTQN